VYRVESGRRLSVAVDVPAVEGNKFFALSKLAIVKVTDSQRALYEALPAGRVLVSLADDASAVLSTKDEGQTFASPLSWGGSFRALPLDSLKGKDQIVVQWTLPGVLPAGQYQVMALIPPNSTAQGEISLLVNGNPVRNATPAPMSQKDYPGPWWVGNIWTLSEAGAVTVQFKVNLKDNTGGVLGIDTIALVQVK
jgi:hypothetical protein